MRLRFVAAGALTLAACTAPKIDRVALPGDPVIVAAAGDISCPALATVKPDRCQQAATAAAVASADFVIALGDLQYPGGSGTSWAGYNNSWGALAAKTLPVVGNHEYLTANAQGFYNYWASKGFPQPRGVWTRDLGNGWTFIAVDANCGKINCTTERTTLDAALVASGHCAIVAWHQPRWSSGDHGSSTSAKVRDFWNTAVARGTALVLNGHEHSYERTIPFNTTVEIIAGTGGKSMDLPTPPGDFTEQQFDRTFGFLRLTLTPNFYLGEYVDISGTVVEGFTGIC